MQPFCGQETIGWYSLDIFQRAQVNVNNYLLSILLQASTLIGYMIAACLLPRVKRRKQFLLSCAFMGVSQALLGFSLKFTVIIQFDNQTMNYQIHFFQESESELQNRIGQVLLPICVKAVSLGYGLGVGAVPASLLGEIIPLKIKSVATSIILCLKFSVISVTLKIFPACVNLLGLPNIFWIHSGICGLVCIIAILILPETQGKTLTELSSMYSKKQKQNKEFS